MLGTPQKIIGPDFGPISPLPTILGNAPIISVDLKSILSDFPVVWGVLRLTESSRKNVGGAPITNLKSCCVGGGGNTEDKRVFDPQIITWNETISNQKASW